MSIEGFFESSDLLDFSESSEDPKVWIATCMSNRVIRCTLSFKGIR